MTRITQRSLKANMNGYAASLCDLVRTDGVTPNIRRFMTLTYLRGQLE